MRDKLSGIKIRTEFPGGRKNKAVKEYYYRQKDSKFCEIHNKKFSQNYEKCYDCYQIEGK